MDSYLYREKEMLLPPPSAESKQHSATLKTSSLSEIFGNECVREVSLNRQVFFRNASNIAENLESEVKPRQQLNPTST